MLKDKIVKVSINKKTAGIVFLSILALIGIVFVVKYISAAINTPEAFYRHYLAVFEKRVKPKAEFNYGNPYDSAGSLRSYNLDQYVAKQNNSAAYLPKFYDLSYSLHAMLFYYESTGDTEHLDKAMGYIDKMIALAPHNANGDYRPWGNWQYDPNWPYPNTDEARKYIEECRLQQVMVPIARTASLIKRGRLRNNSRYNNEANKYLKFVDDALYDYVYYNKDQLGYLRDANGNLTSSPAIPARYTAYYRKITVNGRIEQYRIDPPRTGLPNLRAADEYTAANPYKEFSNLRVKRNSRSPSQIWKDTNTNMAMTSLFMWQATQIADQSTYGEYTHESFPSKSSLYRDIGIYYAEAFKKRLTQNGQRIVWDHDVQDRQLWWKVIHQGQCVVKDSQGKFVNRRGPRTYSIYSCDSALTEAERASGYTIEIEAYPMHDTSHSNREPMMMVFFYEAGVRHNSRQVFSRDDVNWLATILKTYIWDQNERIPKFKNYISGYNGYYKYHKPYNAGAVAAGWAMLGKYDPKVNQLMKTLFANISDNKKARANDFGMNERGYFIMELAATLVRNQR